MAGGGLHRVWRFDAIPQVGRREGTEAHRETQAACLAKARRHPYLGRDERIQDQRPRPREALRISTHFRGDMRNRCVYLQLYTMQTRQVVLHLNKRENKIKNILK
jgi:hypothetical protein